MKVLITAGGTSEKIDSVRSISNMSTGRLGSLIADSFAILPDIKEIYYVCNKAAILPQSGKVKKIYVDSVASLEKMITDILNGFNIDIIIHSMAVSDYRVGAVTSASNLASLIVAQQRALEKISEQTAESIVTKLLNNSEPVMDGNGKISSDVDNMLLLMERTPKVISMFQKISPKSILVGFKLLDTVPHETLIDKAYHLLQANKCGLVLANDLSEIDVDGHIGYLIDSDRNYQRFTTKQEIADGIVTATIRKRRNQQ